MPYRSHSAFRVAGWAYESDRLRAQVRKPGMLFAGLQPEHGDDSFFSTRIVLKKRRFVEVLNIRKPPSIKHSKRIINN
jgi:hypothetical protein